MQHTRRPGDTEDGGRPPYLRTPVRLQRRPDIRASVRVFRPEMKATGVANENLQVM